MHKAGKGAGKMWIVMKLTSHEESEGISEMHQTLHVETRDCECQTEGLESDGLGLMQKRNWCVYEHHSRWLELEIATVFKNLGIIS